MYTDLIDKAPIGSWAWGILVPAVSALLCAGLIALLRPLFARYALARPNARSSHTVPTQQGGGIPVIVATIIVSYGALQFAPFGATAITLQLPIVCIAMLLIACVGVLADIHPANFIPRLLLQTLAVAAVIFVMPPQLRVLPVVPLPLERAALVVGGLWFVNLVNFMDGLDWMMVAETVPISSALAVIGWLGMLPPAALVLSLALCGAMIGFAFFNRPVARLFLGDVGSLPVGLLLGWLLVLLAGNGGCVAAILLPLYYLADSSITLVRRAIKGEKIWHAHRSHFYQRAIDRGFSVLDVVARVFAVNLVLAALALATVLFPSLLTSIAALFCGVALVSWLLAAFARSKR
ncbi:MAG: glycosyl transferase [Xanthobacteraceae bacterium]